MFIYFMVLGILLFPFDKLNEAPIISTKLGKN